MVSLTTTKKGTRSSHIHHPHENTSLTPKSLTLDTDTLRTIQHPSQLIDFTSSSRSCEIFIKENVEDESISIRPLTIAANAEEGETQMQRGGATNELSDVVIEQFTIPFTNL